MMGFVWTRERATADGADLSLWFHFFSPSCSRVWLVNWPFKKKKRETKIISLFLPSSVVDPKLYVVLGASFPLFNIKNIFFSLIVWTFLRIIRHTQHHDLENKARMNWPRLLSTINTNKIKKTHDGLVDLSVRRFDIYQNKAKQTEKRIFCCRCCVSPCLSDWKPTTIFTVTFVSFLFIFFSPIFHCWFKFLIASCIYCVCV